MLGAQPTQPAPMPALSPRAGAGAAAAGANPLAPGVDIMTYPGASAFSTPQQALATSAAESPAAARATAATADVQKMQQGAMASGEALQTLRTDIATMCEKYQALVDAVGPLLPADARAGAEGHAKLVLGSAPGFGEAVNGALQSLQLTNQQLSGLKEARSTKDFALSAVASQKSAVKQMMAQPREHTSNTQPHLEFQGCR